MERNIHYFPPLQTLKRRFHFRSVDGVVIAEIPYDELIRIVQLMLRAMTVDEDWYLANYPDVKNGILNGQFRSAREHWIKYGYIEGRLPQQHIIDSDWYLSKYHDVMEALQSGDEVSALEHYERMGYVEGRLPADI